MNQHHLLLGQLVDFISGRLIDDTHDERYRQKIARILVNEKGYAKSEIISAARLSIQVGTKCSCVPVTFLIRLSGIEAMIVQYGPGSLITRHRPALAMGRLIAPHQLPVVVVSNGEQADILNGATGRIEATEFGGIPNRLQLEAILASGPQARISAKRAQMEARIVMAYEVDGRCPCDDTVCTVETPKP